MAELGRCVCSQGEKRVLLRAETRVGQWGGPHHFQDVGAGQAALNTGLSLGSSDSGEVSFLEGWS